jgi:DNA-binding transcriptional ArsR family regulator
MTRPRHEVEHVRALAAEGRNASEIARATGIARSTVREWLGRTSRRPSPAWVFCPRCNPEAELDDASYVYLLGLYLGDGCISKQPKDVWRLRITQTATYTDHIEECAVAMHAVLPNNVLQQRRQGCVEISSSSKHWPCLFPQHGPGRKHERPIVLAPWQRWHVERYPRLLLRGLVQSDGCRDRNWVTSKGRRYEYARYSFSNASDDIRRIFTDTCDLLGVHWTRPSERVISVARRADVEFLDTFIGPKS